ncbi:LysR family transcriptional regulator [Rhodococcus sp. NPDC057014]|uniref:LysR family transcriptional regulator n=1 Tax=unclassified Rhodococcus (in: high G+C Gram-positive bacteria) TaxID=192944 RepID=UPI00363824A0
MEIDPRRLRYLLAVARAGGILAAADQLHMTPSAVSQQIARLERETGQVLMTRTSQGSVLTAEGTLLAEAGQEVERTLAGVRSRLQQGPAELHGRMRIAGFQSFLSVVIAPALPQWRRALPGVVFELVETELDPHLRSLKEGEFDAAIVELDAGAAETAPPAGIAEVPLLDEPWKLVVPAGTLITDITDLEHTPLPWLGEPEAATAYPARRLRRISGSNKQIVHRYFGTQTALALVAAGEGMTVLPSLALRGMLREGVDVIDVPGLGTRRIVLRSYPRGKIADNLVAAVTGLLREATSTLNAGSGIES